jgi:hypothetical protein
LLVNQRLFIGITVNTTTLWMLRLTNAGGADGLYAIAETGGVTRSGNDKVLT